MLFNGTLITVGFFAILTLTLAASSSSTLNSSLFTLDQVLFNDTATYRTLQENYQQNLSPFNEGDIYLTEQGAFSTNNINGGQLNKRLVVNGHDLEHANQPNFYDAILVQSVPGSQLSANDTTHGRLTVSFQRELEPLENPIEITSLKIKFSIQSNVQSQRENRWLLKDQTSEPYDALLEFYAFSDDITPLEIHGFRAGDNAAEFSFPQDAPIGFVFSAFNGSFVVVNEITIDF
jgi:hypothetical protein